MAIYTAPESKKKRINNFNENKLKKKKQQLHCRVQAHTAL